MLAMPAAARRATSRTAPGRSSAIVPGGFVGELLGAEPGVNVGFGTTDGKPDTSRRPLPVVQFSLPDIRAPRSLAGIRGANGGDSRTRPWMGPPASCTRKAEGCRARTPNSPGFRPELRVRGGAWRNVSRVDKPPVGPHRLWIRPLTGITPNRMVGLGKTRGTGIATLTAWSRSAWPSCSA